MDSYHKIKVSLKINLRLHKLVEFRKARDFPRPLLNFYSYNSKCLDPQWIYEVRSQVRCSITIISPTSAKGHVIQIQQSTSWLKTSLSNL